MALQEKRRKSDYESGDRYHKLLLTGKCYYNKHNQRLVEYLCDCGSGGWALLYSIKTGHTTSCGCNARGGHPIHGLCYHPLYDTWRDMKQRCYNPNYTDYHNYGGRGITICDEWINDVSVFITWAINNGWKRGLSLDRNENNGIYEPTNCKWSTRAVQNRNKRNNVYVTAFGETKCLTDWIADERCQVSFNQIMYRINKMGLNSEIALTMPSLTRRKP